MIEFQQWLGFLLIAVIGLVGFWIFFFLISLLPYWIFGALKDHYKQKKAQNEQEGETQ